MITGGRSRRTIEGLVERWPAMGSFVAVGALCIIGGGLVAAVTRPIAFEAGPWVAAYLVLVGGVAQIALGVGQALLAENPPAASTTRIEAACWNIGVVATVTGTVLAVPALTTIGALITAAALILFLLTVRPNRNRSRRPTFAYQAIVAFVLLSIPVGVVLAWLRHA